METPRRKVATRTISDARGAMPRAVSASGASSPGYPSATDLIASSAQWQRWLEDGLRAVLRPALVAGAIGLASAGCGQEVGNFYADLTGDDPQVAPLPMDAPPTPGGQVVMTPLPSAPGPGATPLHLAPPPAPGPDKPPVWQGVVIETPLPSPAYIPPNPSPPEIDGDIAMVRPQPPPPAVNPPMVRGRIAPVRPIVEDIPVPGGMRPVMPEGE